MSGRGLGRAVAAGLCASLLSWGGASAQSATEFFKGKQISIICYSQAGSTYDLYSRLLARHMPHYVPGISSNMLVKNMVGAGGLLATRFLYNTAPKDGTNIGNISRGIPWEPLLGGASTVDFDPLKFYWLGSMTRESALAISWHTTPVKTAQDTLTKELLVAGTGAGADSEIISKALNGLIGTKFKIISGYNSLTTAALAMERGEIEGISYWSWGAIMAGKPDWIRDKKLNLLFQTANPPHKDIPNVPNASVLAKTDEQRQALELLFARDIIARPYLLPPDVPADRAKLLRAAFVQTMSDKKLLEEAATQRSEIDLVTGEQIEELLKTTLATPPAVVEMVKQAMGR